MYSDRFKPECTHLGFDRWQKSQKNEIGQGNVGKAQKFQEAQKGLSAQILLGICLSLEIRVLVHWYGESISHESSRSLSGEFRRSYYFATSQSPHFPDSLYQSTTSVRCVPHPIAGTQARAEVTTTKKVTAGQQMEQLILEDSKGAGTTQIYHTLLSSCSSFPSSQQSDQGQILERAWLPFFINL